MAYFFAKKIYEKYKVPVGIINASVGGTPIEAWTSEEGLKDFSDLKATIEKNKDTTYINSLEPQTTGNGQQASATRRFGVTGSTKWYERIVRTQRLAAN